tara:strand:- start:1721 stop:2233 length:513 start_codon:yes stop_codon:yes gene_type:complete
MTKKLEQLFDLPDTNEVDLTEEENSAVVDTVTAKDIPEIQTALSSVDKIDAALPSVKELGTSDQEMDDIAQLAQDTFKDLMDLGMNVEARFSGEIFNNASRMLDTALSAKNAKINKKLRIVDLQLKKATLDARLAREAAARGEDTEDGDGHAVDRNQLLMEILGRNSNEK